MSIDEKLVLAIGQRLQGYKATAPRVKQITTEVARMESLMRRHARQLTFEDEPATFFATRRQAAKRKT